MKKIMLIYPPVGTYQRGEDRCQININASCANDYRACNDLGYIASILRQEYKIFLKDYSGEKLTYSDFERDFKAENPDIVFISTTNASIYEDIEFVQKIKLLKEKTIVILKGALFFNIEANFLNKISSADYLIGGEAEFIIQPLLNAHYNDKSELQNIEGICYKNGENWICNKLEHFCEDLDKLPYPDRNLMNNKLYKNPLTNKPMATISISRGCPSSCIYCLSPVISGKKVRFRSINSIIDELTECVEKYKITDFFFKSDTFTINKNYVIELCERIINSNLKGKINWCANSRTDSLDSELLEKMKQAGCTIIALGIESGSDDSLNKIKKGTSIVQNLKAVELVKKSGLLTFGFYIIGFPWETIEHLNQTKDLIFKANTDFIEISAVVPFRGSELYNLYGGEVLGKDSFKNTAYINGILSHKQIENFRKNVILKYYLRPSYIAKKIFNKNINFSLFLNYIKYGLRLLKNYFL